ncbi:MAG: DUF4391 domain-containing protein, partial [Rhodocyclaceae bacterium]|nr:DUF4391 domain-containing protein [Rhodocyclaceae bacterium]
MLLAALVEAFDLPPDSRIDQRVPKKMLVEHGARTAADKRLILDCLDEVRWLAALKPNSVGIAAYRDDAREYLEIALIAANLQGDRSTPARQARLAELIHRAVPYPVVLLAQAGTALELSLAHKRRAHNDTGKVVLDGERLGLCFT